MLDVAVRFGVESGHGFSVWVCGFLEGGLLGLFARLELGELEGGGLVAVLDLVSVELREVAEGFLSGGVLQGL